MAPSLPSATSFSKDRAPRGVCVYDLRSKDVPGDYSVKIILSVSTGTFDISSKQFTVKLLPCLIYFYTVLPRLVQGFNSLARKTLSLFSHGNLSFI